MARKGRPAKHRDRWRIRWTDVHGVRRSESYDSYDDADFAGGKSFHTFWLGLETDILAESAK